MAISRALRTEPVNLEPGAGAFINMAIAVPWSGESSVLATQLKSIEADLGRDMDNPRRAHLSRPCDLDVLGLWGGDERRLGDPAWPADALPKDPWIRPLALEVLAHLHVAVPVAEGLHDGVPLELDGQPIGRGPITLRFS